MVVVIYLLLIYLFFYGVIGDGVFNINEAKKIGKMLLHDNPSELFEC